MQFQRPKMRVIASLTALVSCLLGGCNTSPKTESGESDFERIINDPRVNSAEVAAHENIKYFQFIHNDKMGFRDTNGKVVIQPIYDQAEMFSEGYSAVEVDGKWGLIDESGQYVLTPQYEYLGSVNDGLASYRANNKYGFLKVDGKIVIQPQFDWVGEFSEGLCVVRIDSGSSIGKVGYIDASGKLRIPLQFDYANEFQGGEALVGLAGKRLRINMAGEVVGEEK